MKRVDWGTWTFALITQLMVQLALADWKRLVILLVAFLVAFGCVRLFAEVKRTISE